MEVHSYPPGRLAAIRIRTYCREYSIEMDHLPDSLLLRIFGELEFKDICICSSVCRRWRRVSSDWSLRQVIDVTSQPLSIPKALSLVRQYAGARLVQLRITAAITDESSFSDRTQVLTVLTFRHLRDHCPNLKVLQLTGTIMTEADTSLASSVLDLPAGLTELSFRKSFFYPNMFFQDQPGHFVARSLRLLDLTSAVFLLRFHLGSSDQFPSLRALILEGCYPLYEKSLDALTPLIVNLVLLDVERTPVGNRGVETVLLHGANLRYLFVGNTVFDGEAFETVWRLPVGGRHRSLRLTHVCLRCTPIKACHLPTLLRMTPRLQWLAAAGIYISENVRKSIQQLVPSSCRYLELIPFQTDSTALCKQHVTSHIRKANLDVTPDHNC